MCIHANIYVYIYIYIDVHIHTHSYVQTWTKVTPHVPMSAATVTATVFSRRTRSAWQLPAGDVTYSRCGMYTCIHTDVTYSRYGMYTCIHTDVTYSRYGMYTCIHTDVTYSRCGMYACIHTDIPTIIDPSAIINYRPGAMGSIIVGISVCIICTSSYSVLYTHMQFPSEIWCCMYACICILCMSSYSVLYTHMRFPSEM